jgi:hypothetical protein
VRCLMLRAAQSTGVDPDRISFTGAIQVLGPDFLSQLSTQQVIESKKC